METPSVRDLIKVGFHFGHRTSRWNPRMAPFIFKRRNLIHIIDLRETLRGLITGRQLARAVAAHGRFVLFVGTKKQAANIVEREAQHCAMPYVAERWPGGLLTNYVTIRKRLDRLDELEDLEQTGQIRLYAKKMISSLRREKRKILRNLGGVRQMDRLPGLLVVADPAREQIAVKEARKLDVPIIALTDTDGEPHDIDVIVPGNDDSFGAIEIFFRTMSDAVLAGLAESGRAPAAEAEAPAEASTPEPPAAPAAEEAAEPAAEGAGAEPAAGQADEAPAPEAEQPEEGAALAQGEAEPAGQQDVAPDIEGEQSPEGTPEPDEEAV